MQCLAAGLRELGLQPGDRVAILSENRPEWAIADYACLAARCADVPIYPTLPATADRIHPARLRRRGLLVLRPPPSSRRSLAIRDRDCPALRHVIAFDQDATGPDVLRFDDLIASGPRGAGEVSPTGATMRSAVEPDDLATLIYTSGTTGDPKGVMLTPRQHHVQRGHLR